MLPTAIGSTRGGPIRLLLVEDEALIAMDEKQMLSRHGYEVCVVHSGEDAVRADETGFYDLILMDIDLGRGSMSGTEAARTILDRRSVPILFLTSHAEREMVEKVKGITRYGYVLKSSGEFVLLESITMALELFDAHQVLEERTQQYELALYGGGLGTWDWYPETDEVMLSERAAEMVGRSPEVLPERADELIRFIHPEDRAPVREKLEQHLAGATEAYDVAFRVRHGAGRRVWLSCRGKVLDRARDGTPLRMCGTFADITARKEAAERLAAETERLGGILSTLDIGLIVHDPGYRVSWLNRKMREYFPDREPVGKRCYEIFENRSIPCDQCAVRESFRTGELSTVLSHNHFNGRWFRSIAHPLRNEEGVVEQVLEAVLDVTAQKEAEIALKESEARFHGVLDNTPNIAVQGFAPDGTIHYWNAASGRLYGYSADEAIGANLLDLIIPEEIRDDVAVTIARMAETGETQPAEELRLRRKDGTSVDVYSSHVVVERREGEPELFCLDMDISDRKEADRHKEFLASELNHRVKNNLALVASLVELKNEAVGDAADLTDIRNQIDAIRSVHEKLQEAPNTSLIPVKDYLSEIIGSSLGISGQPRFHVENCISDIELPTRSAVSLGLLVSELATNAAKHGLPQAERPWFSVRLERVRERADGQSGGQEIALVVANDGRPLPADSDPQGHQPLGFRPVAALRGEPRAGAEVTHEPHPVFSIRFPVEAVGGDDQSGCEQPRDEL